MNWFLKYLGSHSDGLGVGFRRSERRHQRTDGFGQDVKYPLRDSLSKCEVVAREENVAEDDSQGGEDNQPQKAKDVLPNGGVFFCC